MAKVSYSECRHTVWVLCKGLNLALQLIRFPQISCCWTPHIFFPWFHSVSGQAETPAVCCSVGSESDHVWSSDDPFGAWVLQRSLLRGIVVMWKSIPGMLMATREERACENRKLLVHICAHIILSNLICMYCTCLHTHKIEWFWCALTGIIQGRSMVVDGWFCSLLMLLCERRIPCPEKLPSGPP